MPRLLDNFCRIVEISETNKVVTLPLLIQDGGGSNLQITLPLIIQDGGG